MNNLTPKQKRFLKKVVVDFEYLFIRGFYRIDSKLELRNHDLRAGWLIGSLINLMERVLKSDSYTDHDRMQLNVIGELWSNINSNQAELIK